jgi:predicted nucleotidyltransferase
MIDLIEQHRSELQELCRRYDVRRLEAFGSAADGGWDPERSDLDFLVEFLPEAAQRSFSGFFDLRQDLQQLFRRKVDLVMPGAIRNPYFRMAVNKQRRAVYGA